MGRPRESRSAGPRELVEADLVAACKGGDEAAWSRLVQATYREVYTLCLRILRDPDDAADATQDAYVRAWRGLPGFRGDAQFTTWLYRVAANAAISKQRGRSRRREHESGGDDEMLTQIAAPDSTEASAEARLDLRAVEAALATLPEHYRSVLVMKDVYGLSIQEVAGELKISETATKVRVHRARKRLKELIERDPDQGTREGSS